MCDLWKSGMDKLLKTETRATQAEGPCQAGGRRGQYSPTTWKGRPVYPVSETEMDPFVWCRKTSCSSMYGCNAIICAVIYKIE
jgi:hypothetical protein